MIILFFVIRLLLFMIYGAEGYCFLFLVCLFVFLCISFTDPVGLRIRCLRTILIWTGVVVLTPASN